MTQVADFTTPNSSIYQNILQYARVENKLPVKHFEYFSAIFDDDSNGDGGLIKIGKWLMILNIIMMWFFQSM